MIPLAPFGRTGHDSTRTIFGAFAVSRATDDETAAVMEVVERYGVNHIDTAPSYGQSEARLGHWFGSHDRDRFFLATKTGARTYAGARDEIRASLARLGVDHVDLIQLHNLVDAGEWETAFGADGALRAAVEARDAGLVRYIGVTGHGLQAPARHRQSLLRFPFDSVLFPYNPVQLRDPAYASDVASLVALCEERGVAMQTIKAITLGPWQGSRPASPITWYEPLGDPADIALIVRWLFARPGLFLNTAGDPQLLPKILAAADHGGPRPSDAEVDALIERRRMSPLFV